MALAVTPGFSGSLGTITQGQPKEKTIESGAQTASTTHDVIDEISRLIMEMMRKMQEMMTPQKTITRV
ncbi:hypothetical protein GCM10028803_58620 [Larkinella knui]